MGLKIIATGKKLPKKALSNEEMCQFVDTDDEWIRTRTGIRSRYKCEDETCLDLAVGAAQDALAKANIDAEEIGAILVATSTADYALPSTACRLQDALGIHENILAFDINAACTGFLHAMCVANGLLVHQKRKYILLVGCEKLSSIMDYTDRSTCVIFGDGAGAAIVEASDKLYYQNNWTRGNEEVLNCKRGDSPYVKMKGNDVFRFAVTALDQALQDVLMQTNHTMDDIDYVVCHQANERIINHVSKKYAGHEDKFYINIYNLGNTSAASIPMALDDLVTEGKIKAGMKVVFIGFGAGLSWSGAIMEV